MDKDKKELADIAKIIGNRIHHIRVNRSLSQTGLAKMLGCDQKLVTDWETGKRLISSKYLFRFCKVLGLSLANFDIYIPGPESFGATAAATPQQPQD